MICGLALIFTATVTPFEVGTGIETKIDGLFACNQLVNTIFTVDIIVQFFLPVPDNRPDHAGELVRNRWQLAKQYLTSWFLLDLVSVLPFDLVVVTQPDLLGSDPSIVKSVKLVRILRLIKLVRVLRTSRMIQRWESSISISYSTRSLVSAVFGIFVCIHWFACLWALLPQLQGSWRGYPGLEVAATARLSTDASCTACDPSDPSTAAICASPCLTTCELEEVGCMRTTT